MTSPITTPFSLLTTPIPSPIPPLFLSNINLPLAEAEEAVGEEAEEEEQPSPILPLDLRFLPLLLPILPIILLPSRPPIFLLQVKLPTASRENSATAPKAMMSRNSRNGFNQKLSTPDPSPATMDQ